MSKKISDQLENVVHGCSSAHHSKRADKFNKAINTEWKIYANKSFDDMIDLARNFGNFVNAHYPGKNRAYHIDRNIIEAYLNSKTATCNDSTLWKIYSRIKKFEICCKRVYFRDKDKFNWNMENVTVPKSTKEDQLKKNKPIPLEISKYAINALSEKDSEVVNGIKFSAYAGTRVEENSCLKVKDVHFTGGEFKLGWIQIVGGPEGGAKGGRARVIPIIDLEAQAVLK